MTTLVVTYLIEVVFSTEVFDRYRNLIDVRQETVHSGRRRKFSPFDQFDSLLNRFAIWEHHDRKLGLTQKRIFGFNGSSYGHGFNLTTRPLPTLVTELGGMISHWNQFLVFDCEQGVSYPWLIASSVRFDDQLICRVRKI